MPNDTCSRMADQTHRGPGAATPLPLYPPALKRCIGGRAMATMTNLSSLYSDTSDNQYAAGMAEARGGACERSAVRAVQTEDGTFIWRALQSSSTGRRQCAIGDNRRGASPKLALNAAVFRIREMEIIFRDLGRRDDTRLSRCPAMSRNPRNPSDNYMKSQLHQRGRKRLSAASRRGETIGDDSSYSVASNSAK